MERYERSTSLQTGLINSQAGTESDALARELQAFTDRRMRDIENEAQRIGTEQGRQAGSEGEPDKRSHLTVAGQAFNKAATLAHQAALQTDIRDSIGQLAIEHDDDPETFQAKIAGLEKGMTDTAGAEYVPFIRQRVADYGGGALLRISQNQQAKLEKEAIDDLKRGAEGFFKDARTAAYEGEFDLVEARRQELTEVLNAAVEAEQMDEGAKDELLQGFESEIIAQDTLGRFNDVVNEHGIEAGNDVLTKWTTAKPSDLGVDVDAHQAIKRKMFGRLAEAKHLAAMDQARGAAQQQAEQKAALSRLNNNIKLMNSGIPLDAESYQQNDADIALNPEKIAEYMDALNMSGELAEFGVAPTANREQHIHELETEINAGGSGEVQMKRVKRLAALKKLHKQVTKAWAENARGEANKKGMLDDDELDWSESEGNASLIPSLQKRWDSSDIGESYTGRSMPLLRKDEAELIGRHYDTLGTSEKLELLGALVEGSGDKQAVATLAQLERGGAGDMAVMGIMVLQGRKGLAADMMLGMEVLEANKEIKPKYNDYSADWQKEIGSALAGSPAVKDIYEGLITAKYAQLKNAKRDFSSDYDKKLFKKAVREVMPIVEFNDDQVMAPPGFTQKQFDAWTDSWTVDDFKNVQAAKNKAYDPAYLMELIEEDGVLVEVASQTGEYGIAIISSLDGSIKPLVNMDGTKVIMKIGN